MCVLSHDGAGVEVDIQAFSTGRQFPMLFCRPLQDTSEDSSCLQSSARPIELPAGLETCAADEMKAQELLPYLCRLSDLRILRKGIL